ncbi:MAG: sodium:solute symporter family transporter [Thermoguttaceae bacterium]|jgi:SSS family solute:Na+ symporter
MQTLQVLDYVAIGVFLALTAAVGGFFGWFVKDVSGYFKGSGVIPWPVAGISNYMSMFSTFVFVAYAGIAYNDGLVALTVVWCTVPPCILAATVFAHRWRRAELTTPVEYLETRFGAGARQFFSWTGLVMRVLDNVVRMYAIGLFLATVLPWNLEKTILIAGLIITFYTVIGGLWAVAVLDTIQFAVLLSSSVILVPLALIAAGGFSGIAAVAPDHLYWLNGPKGAPLWLLAYYLMITLKYNANWAFIQRLYCVRDERAARRVAWLSGFLFLATPILFVIPPLAARVVVPGLTDPEMAYVAIAAKLLPPGLLGMMLAAMFSATMSSLNSEYNIMAGVITNDVYKRLLCPQAGAAHLLWVGRLLTILIGMGITFGAMFIGGMGGAFEANKLFTGILAIPLAIPLLFGLLLRRPTTHALVAAVLGGSALALVLNFWRPLSEWLARLFAAGGDSAVWAIAPPSWEAATLATIAASVLLFCLTGWLVRPTAARRQIVDQFFRRLRTPIGASELPTADPRVRRRLGLLFGGSFIIVGLLYVVVSAASIAESSGAVGAACGLVCTVCGIAIWRLTARQSRTNGATA